jgi:hypothetical protein
MEERTQIKFSNPDIDGTPQPQLITLEEENPIEGQSEREDGEPFVWHKWLCTNDQYFMASGSLDAMLKLIPNKVGSPIKIEKVLNPKGGYPFFQVNGMNKDELVKSTPQSAPPPVAVFQAPDTIPVMPPQITTAPASNTDGSLTRLEQKIDQVLRLLTSAKEDIPKEAELPF